MLAIDYQFQLPWRLWFCFSIDFTCVDTFFSMWFKLSHFFLFIFSEHGRKIFYDRHDFFLLSVENIEFNVTNFAKCKEKLKYKKFFSYRAHLCLFLWFLVHEHISLLKMVFLSASIIKFGDICLQKFRNCFLFRH